MPAPWRVTRFPRCLYHVFLSHCAEDRGWMVSPLFDRLERDGLVPWFDTHHYPAGADPNAALREEMLRCRHIVYLITLATLDQARGWAVTEKAYGGIIQSIIQSHLHTAGEDFPRVELPLFFIPRDHPVLPRSVWLPLVSRGQFHTPADGGPVDWAVRQIARFVRREQERAQDVAKLINEDPVFRKTIRAVDGLEERVRGLYPSSGEPPL